jgi:hypothetical protein
MGAKIAFENMPQPWAVEAITELLRRREFKTLVGALKAMDNDLSDRLEIALTESYDAVCNEIRDKIEALEKKAKSANECGNHSEAATFKHNISRLQVALKKSGKADAVNKLGELHPDLASYFNSMSPRWRTSFWAKLPPLPRSSGY